MNLTNSLFASLSMALTIVAAGAGTTSPSEPLAGGRLFGLWQTNGVLFNKWFMFRDSSWSLRFAFIFRVAVK
jgi:hypothetical protein